MNQKPSDFFRTIIRTVAVFVVLLVASGLMIMFGSGQDAVTVAQSKKAGVLTADEVNTAFEVVSGRLVKRDIQESQWVKAGDVLMQLDDTDMRIAITQTKARIDQLKAQLASEILARDIASGEADVAELTAWRQIEEAFATLKAAKAQKEFADREFKRTQALVKTGGVSRSVFDNAKQAWVSANSAVTERTKQLAAATVGADREGLKRLEKTGSAQGMKLLTIENARASVKNRDNAIESVKATLTQNEASLEQLLVNEKRLTLTAPEEGKILQILYEKGELVPTGATAVLLQTKRMYFDVYVDETRAGHIAAGDTVQSFVPALGKTVQGQVRFVTAAPSFADLRFIREKGQADLTQFQVRIYTDPVEGLLPGMTMEIEL